MTVLVVDASAALALLRDEPGAGEARRHLAEQVREGAPTLVPSFFWLELVNVLARRYQLAPSAIVEAVFELEQIGLRTAHVGRPETLAVIDA
ncbi:MAG TPA: PIN domain-containing protein, partial [Candidatus Limnocylindria bacterium]